MQDEMSESSSNFTFESSDSQDCKNPQNTRKPKSVFLAKKVRVNKDLKILVVNGHTGKDSRRPITNLGELIFFMSC